MSRKLAVTAMICGFFVVAQPAAAQGWSDRILASVSAWTPWAGSATAPTTTPPTEAAGIIATALTYVPAFATDAASQASGALDRALLLAKSYGPGFPTLESDAKDSEGWSDTVKQSMGCLISGSTGTVVALLAGGENLVNIIAGGIVAPANPMVLYVGLVGVVFTSFCAVGQALTPLYLQYFEEPQTAQGPGGPKLPAQLPNARVYYITHP